MHLLHRVEYKPKKVKVETEKKAKKRKHENYYEDEEEEEASYTKWNIVQMSASSLPCLVINYMPLRVECGLICNLKLENELYSMYNRNNIREHIQLSINPIKFDSALSSSSYFPQI